MFHSWKVKTLKSYKIAWVTGCKRRFVNELLGTVVDITRGKFNDVNFCPPSTNYAVFLPFAFPSPNKLSGMMSLLTRKIWSKIQHFFVLVLTINVLPTISNATILENEQQRDRPYSIIVALSRCCESWPKRPAMIHIKTMQGWLVRQITILYQLKNIH